MATAYNAIEGDALDAIIFAYYGSVTDASLALVLDANQGIADFGCVLKARTVVNLPDMPSTASTKDVSLWD